jgi:amylosucrase
MIENNKSTALLDKILSGKQAKSYSAKFKKRLGEKFGSIFENFHRLYPYRNDVWEHIEELVSTLDKNHQARSSSLKKLDDYREKNPNWFLSEKISGMMLYVDRFAGDLKGLNKKLDYFDELGVNLLHLMPILKSPPNDNDGGYAVSDYRSIEPAIGNMKDLNNLAEDLKKKDMLLMMDFVLNHTSDQHEWAEKAKAGEKKYQDYYYCYDDRSIPDQFEQSLPQVFPDTSPGNFTYSEELNKWVMTVFNSFQWDLNYTNPAVFIEMVDILLFLSNQGVDIIRLDALAFMWKKIGTDSQNLEEAHLLVQTMKACAQIAAPSTLFLAEAIVAPTEIVKYFGQVHATSNECDIAYNATTMVLLCDSIATKNNKLLSTTIQNIPKKPRGTTWLNYVRCHDDIGLGYEDQHAEWAGYSPWDHRQFLINFLTGKLDWSFSRGRPFMEDKEKGDARISGSLASLAGVEKGVFENDEHQIDLAVKRILLLHSVILSYGGLPVIYAGDELGTLNDYSFENNPITARDNRWMHRPKMDWATAELRKKSGTYQNKLFAGLTHLLNIRKNSPEFADLENCHLVDCHNEHLLSYVRVFDRHKTLIVANLNDHSEELKYEMIEYMGFGSSKDLLDKVTGKKLSFKNFKYQLDPYQFVWIYQK